MHRVQQKQRRNTKNTKKIPTSRPLVAARRLNHRQPRHTSIVSAPARFHTTKTTDTAQQDDNSTVIPAGKFNPALKAWVGQSIQPKGMHGIVDNNQLYNMGATLNISTGADGWLYNLSSGVHPAAHWIIAPFSVPSPELNHDGMSYASITAPPAPFSIPFHRSGEISYQSPIHLNDNILQVRSIEDAPTVTQFKVSTSENDQNPQTENVLNLTFTNRWCDSENPRVVHVEEKLTYDYVSPQGLQAIVQRHVPDLSVQQPVQGVDYDFERPSLSLDDITLFRYGALTWNSYRPHFNKEFARELGYKDTIVHPHLQVAMALDLLGDVSAAMAPSEPILLKHVYTILNAVHHSQQQQQQQQQQNDHDHGEHDHHDHHHHNHQHQQPTQQQQQQQQQPPHFAPRRSHGTSSHNHSHDHSHDHDHDHDHDHAAPQIDDIPSSPWHARFQQLRNFIYTVNHPLYVNTKVRVLAKIIDEEQDLEEYNRNIQVSMESRAHGHTDAKLLTMNDLLRNSQAYVSVWIQDAEDPSLTYFKGVGCFDRPSHPTFNQVPEDGLNHLLKDIQEQLTSTM